MCFLDDSSDALMKKPSIKRRPLPEKGEDIFVCSRVCALRLPWAKGQSTGCGLKGCLPGAQDISRTQAISETFPGGGCVFKTHSASAETKTNRHAVGGVAARI